MSDIASRNSAGWMGPGHVRQLELLKSAADPTDYTSIHPTLDFNLAYKDGTPFEDYLNRNGIGGYRLNASGTLIPTGDKEPMIEYNIDGSPKGTFIGKAYSNLLLYSEQFDNASWTKARATVSANATIAPDGTLTADKIVEDNTATNSHFVEITYAGATASTVYTFSVFLKAGERTRISISVYNGSVGVGNIFDLSNGTEISSINAGIGKIESVGNGWYRCSTTFTMATTSTAYCDIFIRDIPSGSYSGDGVSGIYAWGAQLINNEYPLPYVKTEATAVTRAVDDFIVSGSAFTDFYNAAEGTFFISGILPAGTHVAGNQCLLQTDDTTANNRNLITKRSSDNAIVFQSIVGGVTQQTATSIPVTNNTFFKLAVSYKLNNFQFSMNGGSTIINSSGTLPTVTRLVIGATNVSTVNYDGHLSRIIYWPKALDAVTLQKVTA